jgi:hypothetical protein
VKPASIVARRREWALAEIVAWAGFLAALFIPAPDPVALVLVLVAIVSGERAEYWHGRAVETSARLAAQPKPVRLPWAATSGGFGLAVGAPGSGGVPLTLDWQVDGDGARRLVQPQLDPATARGLAQALLTAADRAEGRTP